VVPSGFTASGPTRAPDTRYGTGATRKPVGPGGVTTLTLPAASATADDVVLNVTETGATAVGYLTAYPGTGARPTAANLNFGPQLRPRADDFPQADQPALALSHRPSLTTRFEAVAQSCPIPPMSCGDTPVGARNDRARPGVVRTRRHAVASRSTCVRRPRQPGTPPSVGGVVRRANGVGWAGRAGPGCWYSVGALRPASALARPESTQCSAGGGSPGGAARPRARRR
jgi:hypothetical protein